jgi:antitoxin FitA
VHRKNHQMPDLHLREVPQHTIDALERQAILHGRSIEAEHRTILEAALRAGFWERAAALREETRGRISTDSTDLIRRDRDER